MRIIAPYCSSEIGVIKECGLSQVDSVERSGFVPNEEKISTFIESGMILMNQRQGIGEYEIQGGESDFDPDSVEYRDELTREAEEFDQQPLLQSIDKIEAEEILDNAEKQIVAKKRAREKRVRDKSNEIEISDSSITRLANSINRKIEIKAESEPSSSPIQK